MKTYCSVPAKLILSGEHAVLYQCPALSMAINLHTDCRAEYQKKSPPSLTVELSNFNQTFHHSFAEYRQQATQIEQRYQQFLPSLDLKRKQLTAQRAKALAHLKQTERELQQRHDIVGELLPMLANEYINLDGLVKIARFEIGEENVVGIHLPVVQTLDIQVLPYSFMSKPQFLSCSSEMPP